MVKKEFTKQAIRFMDRWHTRWLGFNIYDKNDPEVKALVRLLRINYNKGVMKIYE